MIKRQCCWQDTVYRTVHDDALKTALRQAKTPEDAVEIGSLACAIKAFNDAQAMDAQHGLAETAGSAPEVPGPLAGAAGGSDAQAEPKAGQR